MTPTPNSETSSLVSDGRSLEGLILILPVTFCAVNAINKIFK